MSFLSSLFGKGKKDGKFLSEEAYEVKRAKQTHMSLTTLAVLGEHGVTPQSKLKLDYFFYTNSLEKAAGLACELEQKGYEVEHGPNQDKKNPFCVEGQTQPIQMDESTVVIWVGEMCDLGYRFDCEFDGWGTMPNQDEEPS